MFETTETEFFSWTELNWTWNYCMPNRTKAVHEDWGIIIWSFTIGTRSKIIINCYLEIERAKVWYLIFSEPTQSSKKPNRNFDRIKIISAICNGSPTSSKKGCVGRTSMWRCKWECLLLLTLYHTAPLPVLVPSFHSGYHRSAVCLSFLGHPRFKR